MSEMVGKGSKYTDEDRCRAVVEFYVSGNMTEVAKRTGIPRTTIIGWKESNWWVDLFDKVRHEKDEEFDAKTTKLINSALEEAQDRVENGDYRVGKDGNLIRVPMSGRDLTTNAAIFFDKRQLHRNQPTVIRNGGELTQEFADTFRDFARNSIFVDGEYRLIKPVDQDQEDLPLGECGEVE